MHVEKELKELKLNNPITAPVPRPAEDNPYPKFRVCFL